MKRVCFHREANKRARYSDLPAHPEQYLCASVEWSGGVLILGDARHWQDRPDRSATLAFMLAPGDHVSIRDEAAR